MTTEQAIPIVDLRLLSQAEIAALAASSPAAYDLHRSSSVVTPRIDRSVFNESAGSRKQTFSRLRLAPRPPRPPSPDRDNDLILHFLRRLVSPDSSSSSPPASASAPAPAPAAAVLALAAPPPSTALPDVEQSPCKAIVVVEEDRDRGILNGKGEVVDVVGLAEMEDPFGEELRRRTEGLKTEEELLLYMAGMEGQWGSRRKRRRVVDAEGLGDVFPRGWKALLALKRKEGLAWLHCRSYISPNGRTFSSCKEVASYMFSLVGIHDSKQQISSQAESRSSGLDKLTPRRAAGSASQVDIVKDNPGYLSVMPISSMPADQETPSTLFRVDKQIIEPKRVLECHKCNLTFGDKDTLVQHLLSFHQNGTERKRRRLGIGDGVIVKDGMFICQFCDKSFTERRRYNGHVGTHVRGPGLGAESGMRKTPYQTPLAAVPISQIDVLTNKREESCNVKSIDSHVGSSTCRPSMENQEIIQNAKNVAHELSQVAHSSNSPNNQIHNYDANQDRPLMENQEIIQNAKNVAHEFSQVAHSSNSPNNQIHNYDANQDRTEKIDEKCDTTLINSTFCVETTSPSMVDKQSVSQECSHDISHEDSVMKPVPDQINDTDMDGDRLVENVNVESSNVMVIKPNECLNTILCNTCQEIDNITSMSKLVDTETLEDDIKGSISEVIVEQKSAMDVKLNESLNTVSTSVTNTNTAACEIVNGHDLLSSISKPVGSIDKCDVIDYKCADLVDGNNSTDMEPDSRVDALSPPLVILDSMPCQTPNEIGSSSCTMISGIETYHDGQKKGFGDVLLTTTDNRTSSCLDTMSPSFVDLDSMTCEASNELSLSTCIPISRVEKYNQERKGDAEAVMLTTTGNMASSRLETLSPSFINFDGMTGEASNELNLSNCAMIPGIEKYDKEQKDTDNALLSTIDNRTSYGIGTYSNNIEMDVTSNMLKSDNGSVHMFSDNGSFVGSTSSNCHASAGTGFPRNFVGTADCTFSVSMLEETNINALENCFHNSKTEDVNNATVTDTSSSHINVARTSWPHSSDGFHFLDMMPEQEIEVGPSDVGQKHGNIARYEDLRMGVAQPMEFDFMTDQESLPPSEQAPQPMEFDFMTYQESMPSTSQQTNGMGYVAEMEDVNGPPIDLDWGLSLPEFKAACMWCGRDFYHDGMSSELQSDMIGLICPICKDRIS